MSRRALPGPGTLAVAAVALLVVVSCTLGFLLLPPRDPLQGLWLRICGAAGVWPATPGASAGPLAPGGTRVVIPPALLRPGAARETGHGATLALACAVCHGVDGVSHSAAPELAGLPAETIYKQLLDYQTGAREGGAMNGIAGALDTQEVLDLARFYSTRATRPDAASLDQAPSLVRVGDPMRNIAPCSACHVANGGAAARAPRLDLQTADYLRAQLTNFQRGVRHNDRSAVMRSSARGMTPAEIVAVSRYYSGGSP